MPLYDLMYIIKPVVPRNQVVEILKRTGEYVCKSGGVVTEVTSFGTRELAYDFKLQGEKFSEGSIVQMSFLVAPKVLKELRHQVHVDERVMRYLFYKKREMPTITQMKKDEKVGPAKPLFPGPNAAKWGSGFAASNISSDS